MRLPLHRREEPLLEHHKAGNAQPLRAPKRRAPLRILPRRTRARIKQDGHEEEVDQAARHLPVVGRVRARAPLRDERAHARAARVQVLPAAVWGDLQRGRGGW